MKILITGVAGFIGSHLVEKLLKSRVKVVGIDNFNTYYDPKIKESNLKKVIKDKGFILYHEDITNYKKMRKIFGDERPQKVIHLAARAGVRPSIDNPLIYAKVNVLGTVSLLKLSVDCGIKLFIFGSSSSVYGNSSRLPFSEDDSCDEIISPYGSSKRAAEFWVETFYKTYGLKATILRFFTVYGPRGRPDMAPALFTKAILKKKSIKMFGDGSSSRDYTYIDDIIDGIEKALDKNLDFEVINLGNNHSVTLADFIKTLGEIIGKKTKIKKLPNQTGDVEKTWANIEKARNTIDWNPKTRIEDGLRSYINFLKID